LDFLNNTRVKNFYSLGEKMKKISLSIVIVLVLMLSLAGVVSAVTDGELDGDGHPFVGLMVADDANGNPLWRCSGTLISPTLFLTAGHCTEAPAARATIWFESNVQDFAADLGYPFGGSTSVDGTTFVHPQFDPNAFFLFDLGMVVLDEPVYMATYGTLPGLNQLDSLRPKRNNEKAVFTSVGYGLQESFPDAASWKTVALKIRMVSHPYLLQINTPGFTGDSSILLSNNANTGGTCFGDSGGPNFLGDTNIIAGVTSFGLNSTCAGTGGVYRIDRADGLNWINAFLAGDLP
jgi:hypothetical protein